MDNEILAAEKLNMFSIWLKNGEGSEMKNDNFYPKLVMTEISQLEEFLLMKIA